MFHMYIYIIIPGKESGNNFFIVMLNNAHKKKTPKRGLFSIS